MRPTVSKGGDECDRRLNVAAFRGQPSTLLHRTYHRKSYRETGSEPLITGVLVGLTPQGPVGEGWARIWAWPELHSRSPPAYCANGVSQPAPAGSSAYIGVQQLEHFCPSLAAFRLYLRSGYSSRYVISAALAAATNAAWERSEFSP